MEKINEVVFREQRWELFATLLSSHKWTIPQTTVNQNHNNTVWMHVLNQNTVLYVLYLVKIKKIAVDF